MHLACEPDHQGKLQGRTPKLAKGFRALLLGFSQKESFYDGQPVDLGPPYGIVLRKDLYPLYTDDLYHVIRLWQDFRKFGLPHGGGYANESEEYIAVISALEDEYNETVSYLTKKSARKN